MKRRRVLLIIAAVLLFGILAAWIVSSYGKDPVVGTWKPRDIGTFTVTPNVMILSPDGNWAGFIPFHLGGEGTWHRATWTGKMEATSRETLRRMGASEIVRYELDGVGHYPRSTPNVYEFYLIDGNQFVVTENGTSTHVFKREPGLVEWKAHLKIHWQRWF